MTYFGNPDYLFKIVLVGNSAVGKSSILRTAWDQQFDTAFMPTIGVDFKIQTFAVADKTVKLQIWDTAGQERFKSICRSYYKGSHGIIFAYDITDKQSFRDIENWVDDVERIVGKDVCKVLVGNKSDMESKRKVSYEEGAELAKELGMNFVETSAMSSHNVDGMFKAVAKDMKEKIENEKEGAKEAQQKKEKIDLADAIEKEKTSASCCYYM